eukprot:CAMPEP_0114227358 /NCGR_PEP_ID=MMETSP0058-20121206/1747_1 /TAXON_ID=36894 /ORGANISM="Pyramimonas parkeae, CCMP726" /LENGTH=760 /DNA_ID=CAMNT_0001338193 /DNA_START=411 /DNA_END=2694 /DNA_ORIENTATION=-
MPFTTTFGMYEEWHSWLRSLESLGWKSISQHEYVSSHGDGQPFNVGDKLAFFIQGYLQSQEDVIEKCLFRRHTVQDPPLQEFMSRAACTPCSVASVEYQKCILDTKDSVAARLMLNFCTSDDDASCQHAAVSFYPTVEGGDFVIPIEKYLNHTRWNPGDLVKMLYFESMDDLVGIHWYGEVISVQPRNPLTWPDSSWLSVLVHWIDCWGDHMQVSPWELLRAEASEFTGNMEMNDVHTPCNSYASLCQICNDGDNMLRCNGCYRSFHADCLKGKSLSAPPDPNGLWSCNDCQQRCSAHSCECCRLSTCTNRSGRRAECLVGDRATQAEPGRDPCSMNPAVRTSEGYISDERDLSSAGSVEQKENVLTGAASRRERLTPRNQQARLPPSGSLRGASVWTLINLHGQQKKSRVVGGEDLGGNERQHSEALLQCDAGLVETHTMEDDFSSEERLLWEVMPTKAGEDDRSLPGDLDNCDGVADFIQETYRAMYPECTKGHALMRSASQGASTDDWDFGGTQILALHHSTDSKLNWQLAAALTYRVRGSHVGLLQSSKLDYNLPVDIVGGDSTEVLLAEIVGMVVAPALGSPHRFQKQLLLQLESLLNGYTRPGVRLHQIHVMLMPTAKDAEVLDFHQPSPQEMQLINGTYPGSLGEETTRSGPEVMMRYILSTGNYSRKRDREGKCIAPTLHSKCQVQCVSTTCRENPLQATSMHSEVGRDNIRTNSSMLAVGETSAGNASTNRALHIGVGCPDVLADLAELAW